MIVFPLHHGRPHPQFVAIQEIIAGQERVGFLDHVSQDKHMRFSAQYWLAPTLIVHSDPYCCALLITTAPERAPQPYTIRHAFADGWFVMEHD